MCNNDCTTVVGGSFDDRLGRFKHSGERERERIDRATISARTVIDEIGIVAPAAAALRFDCESHVVTVTVGDEFESGIING
jgi:hypothetical protein